MADNVTCDYASPWVTEKIKHQVERRFALTMEMLQNEIIRWRGRAKQAEKRVSSLQHQIDNDIPWLLDQLDPDMQDFFHSGGHLIEDTDDQPSSDDYPIF